MFYVFHLGNAPVACSVTVYFCVIPWSLLLKLRAVSPLTYKNIIKYGVAN